MNASRTLIALILCAVCVVRGEQTERVVSVGGDVPKPGPIKFEDDGMTIESAMAGVGMDLGPFFAKVRGDSDGSRYPVRVMVIRQGKTTIYDPSVDAAVLRASPLELNDTIIVTDFRQHPKKIEGRRQRIERMIELGSTEIVAESMSLAILHSEYDEWRGQAGAAPAGSDEHLKMEATRLVKEGRGTKILEILDLKLSALQLEGLGPAHPAVMSTISLRRIFHDLVRK